jgi:hypothetical protein
MARIGFVPDQNSEGFLPKVRPSRQRNRFDAALEGRAQMTDEPKAVAQMAPSSVPFTEQLRSVPDNARLRIDDDDGPGAGSSWYPVGRYCHDAADIIEWKTARIADLQAEVAALRKDAERWQRLRRSNPGREFDLSSGPGKPKVMVIRIDLEGCERWNDDGSPDFPAALDAAMDDEPRGAATGESQARTPKGD